MLEGVSEQQSASACATPDSAAGSDLLHRLQHNIAGHIAAHTNVHSVHYDECTRASLLRRVHYDKSSTMRLVRRVQYDESSTTSPVRMTILLSQILVYLMT